MNSWCEIEVLSAAAAEAKIRVANLTLEPRAIEVNAVVPDESDVGPWEEGWFTVEPSRMVIEGGGSVEACVRLNGATAPRGRRVPVRVRVDRSEAPDEFVHSKGFGLEMLAERIPWWVWLTAATGVLLAVTTVSVVLWVMYRTVLITLNPANATIFDGSKVKFGIEVEGKKGQPANWKLLEPDCGTISDSGEYIAPNRRSSCTVQAVSRAYPRAIATAKVAVEKVTVGVSPETVKVFDGQTAQFAAKVEGTKDLTVDWKVLEAGCGTIGNGLYIAPIESASCTVQAVSRADPRVVAMAKVAVGRVTVTASPETQKIFNDQTVQFAAKVEGTSDQAVNWMVLEAGCGTIGNGLYVAPSEPASCTVQAVSRTHPRVVAKATVTVEKVKVTESPQTARVFDGQNVQFVANVEGTNNHAVDWKVLETGCGTISDSGQYTAPSRLAATCTAQAISRADPRVVATAKVAVEKVTVTLSPETATVFDRQTVQFAAKVEGTKDLTVDWSVDPGCGTISNGVYIAPSGPMNCMVRAISHADPRVVAKASVEVPTVVLKARYVSQFSWIWNDAGSGADRDGEFYRPALPGGYYAIGHLAQGYHGAPNGQVLVVQSVDPTAIAPPLDYEYIWNDSGSGADRDGSMWQPIAPPNYIALGAVAQLGWNKPDVSVVVCVRSDLVLPGKVTSLLWNDDESGASGDFSAWSIEPGDPAVGLQTGCFLGCGSYNCPTNKPVWVLNKSRILVVP